MISELKTDLQEFEQFYFNTSNAYGDNMKLDFSGTLNDEFVVTEELNNATTQALIVGKKIGSELKLKVTRPLKFGQYMHPVILPTEVSVPNTSITLAHETTNNSFLERLIAYQKIKKYQSDASTLNFRNKILKIEQDFGFISNLTDFYWSLDNSNEEMIDTSLSNQNPHTKEEECQAEIFSKTHLRGLKQTIVKDFHNTDFDYEFGSSIRISGNLDKEEPVYHFFIQIQGLK